MVPISRVRVRIMVLNATLNNISAISWWGIPENSEKILKTLNDQYYRETIDKDITLKNETIKFGLKLVV